MKDEKLIMPEVVIEEEEEERKTISDIKFELRKSKREDLSFIPHWYCYIAFIIYLINQFYYGLFLSSYTPLEISLTNTYHISQTYIVMTSSIFLLGNLLFAIFVYPISKKIGLTKIIILSNFIGFFGSFLRIFSEKSFFFVLIGQFFLGIGSCFIVNTTIQFCYNWFHPKNRPLFLAISSFMNIVGGGAGNMIPILFIDESLSDDKIKKNYNYYNLFMMYLTLAVFVINLFFFKGKPPKGYGHLIPHIKKKNKINFFVYTFSEIKKLLSIKLFRVYLFIFCLCNSNITFLGSMFDLIVEDFGLSASFGSIASLIIICVGLLSSIIYSIFFMKYEKQKRFQVIFSCFTFFKKSYYYFLDWCFFVFEIYLYRNVFWNFFWVFFYANFSFFVRIDY